MGKPSAGGSFVLSSSMQVYLCPSPELYPLYHRPNSIVIIVDIFRASTTMIAAFAHGAKGILPVASTEEAEETGKRLGALIAAERNVVRCDFAQLGNDPAEYTTDLVSGREIVFTTTNGTRALTIAREHGAEEILVGALTNLHATIDYCQRSSRDVVVLAAVREGPREVTGGDDTSPEPAVRSGGYVAHGPPGPAHEPRKRFHHGYHRRRSQRRDQLSPA